MSQLNANTTKPCKFQGVYKIWLGDQGAKRFCYHALLVEKSPFNVTSESRSRFNLLSFVHDPKNQVLPIFRGR